MKCFTHDAVAVGACPNCGRGLCAECARLPWDAGSRLACSDACARALAQRDRSLEMLLDKSRQSARANSVYYFVSGTLSASAALASWHWEMPQLLTWFLGGSALALTVSGIWFGRAAKR